MRIAVIGAGITGLTAAFELAKQNCKVTIFESEKNVGGLAQGFPFHGTNIELFYHHIFKTDKNLIRLAQELGIENNLIWNNSSIGLYWGNKLYPFSTPFDLFRFSPLSLSDKLRLGLVILYLQKKTKWKNLSSVPADTWMKKYCGEKPFNVIFQPLLKGKFQESYQNISMVWLWARIHTRANSKERGDSQEKLGYFKGGFDVLTKALKENLMLNGASMRLDEKIIQITSNKNGSVNITSHLGNYMFDKVLITIPSYLFGELIKHNLSVPKEYIDTLNSIKYIGAICILFTLERSLNPYYWVNINDPNSPFVVFIEHTNLISKKYYGGKHVYYLGTYISNDHPFFSMNNNEIYTEFFNYLTKLFPSFSVKEVIEKHVFKCKNAQHIVDIDYTHKIPDYRTPLENVYLSNFSQIFPEDRGINFAVREGGKISCLILNRQK
jgi:protoporphyrinogen oxidase